MPREKSRKSSWWKILLRFVVVRLLPLAIIVGLFFWQWSNITSWVNRAVTGILQLFGWGLLLIAIFVAILIGIICLRKSSLLIRYWNRWLGGIALLFAVWGVLAFFPGEGVLQRLGGGIGLSVIGESAIWAPLRVLGLVVVGAFLVAPKPCARLCADFGSWMAGLFNRSYIPKPIPEPAEVPEAKAEVPVRKGLFKRRPEPKPVPLRAVPQKIVSEEEPASTVTKPEDMRQVAQEIWKKYGESSAQITADGWRLPPVDILDKTAETEFSQADNLKKARLIEEALASYGVETKVVQINVGPTVTQFGVEPGWDRKFKEIKERDRNGELKVRSEEVSKTRVKVERISALANDLALNLGAPSIRIEAPVPGKSVVGIEVPNTTIGLVSLRSVVESSAFQKMEAKSKLTVALGKGAGGEAIVADLTKMPHLLIAGATGSGKTVCINSTICGFLLHNTPGDLRFIMIDPKRVELTPYNSIPHLATPVIVDTNKALAALRWLSQEMDKRYQTLAAARARNIEAYNKSRQSDKLPYLVLVIDELADLMMTSTDEVERTLCRLAQLARATGIHLVVATQRPSVDVVTGLIKANFPTRISFAVTSQVDSRTILDTAGAEKLLGRGDMLFMPTEAAKPKRLQGCYVSDAETERLVYFWSSERREEASQLKLEDMVAETAGRQAGLPEDPLLNAARELQKQHKHISVSFLQRHLRIGYPRAARLMDELEEEQTEEQESSGQG